MVYGTDTRSYNRSPERREMKRQCAEVTEKYLAGEITFKPGDPYPLMCRCPQRSYPHEILIHRQIEHRSVHRDRMEWPWSLRLLPTMERI